MRCMQADIYSFGMLMWEIVMGTMPWERMTVGQIFFAVVQQNTRPAVPETFPAGYKDLMEVRPGHSSCRIHTSEAARTTPVNETQCSC